MGYRHDIFISYRRDSETLAWIQEHFLPLLKHRVGQELGRQPDVYVDTRLESGSTWPVDLARALGGSRILISLWSRNYLSSDWCTAELSLMLERERQTGLRTVDNPYGLIVPAFIHDGQTFPAELSHIQYFEIQYMYNPRMARNSPRAEALDAELAQQAPAIARCIDLAPAWSPAWSQAAAQEFFGRLNRQAAEQTTLPRFTAG